jgi:hypothetical protein
MSNLLAFKLGEARIATDDRTIPSSQNPYLHMKKPSEQMIGALNYERAKKRRHPLNFPQEVDRAVSEANLVKTIQIKEQMSFKDWFV